MDFRVILGEAAFVLMLLFFLLFCIYSLLEKEKRAFWRSLLVFLATAAVNGGFFLFPIPIRNWLFLCLFWLFFLALLFFVLSARPRQSIRIVGEQKRIDERDVIFARFDLRRDSSHFSEYYSRNPEKKEKDDIIRSLSDILSPDQIKKNPGHFTLASAEFEFLEQQLDLVDGEVSPYKTGSSAEANTDSIKKIIKYLGADLCGVCALDQAYVYSHVGRGPETYGQPIVQDHTFAVVFAVEMDFTMVSAAPKSPVIIETGKKYAEAARISIIAARTIRHMGYSARAHIAGSNYQTLITPLGWSAGLGELGRLGMLITRPYGPRVRLGLVTTDLPMIPALPIVWGIQDFCENCIKCAENCPSRAIPFGEKTVENGVLKWVLNREECYEYWRKAGTDCAVCMSVCPYGKPANFFHGMIRFATSRSKKAQSLSLRGDDFFYGRHPQRKPAPF